MYKRNHQFIETNIEGNVKRSVMKIDSNIWIGGLRLITAICLETEKALNEAQRSV